MPSGLGLAHKIVDDEHALRINLMADLESCLLREWSVGVYPPHVQNQRDINTLQGQSL